MFNRLALSLLLLGGHSAISMADNRSSDREVARAIGTKLNMLVADGKLDQSNLTITVKQGNVTLTGRIENVQASRLILESVISACDITGVEMKLGIGREPASAAQPMLESESARRPLSWDDGDWPLNFRTEPIRHRAMR